tara:strand:- start:1866 stop:2315 length:450 start_codon:yes stop_codon:yes gene_type:complete
MGNIADKKRFREKAGERIHKGGVNITDKDEMMYIPFVQSGNPDEERPWLYKGYYSMPDGSIDMEMKRMDGHMEITISSVENYKEYIEEAVGMFVKKVFEESPHDAKTISVDKHETEVDVLKKEIIKLQIDNENAMKTVEKFREVMESLE